MTQQPGNSRPEFATNDETTGERVADAINALLGGIRQLHAQPPHIAIASAYFNPGGFNLLAEELSQMGPVRLLLGAEPTDIDERSRVRPLGRSRRRRNPSPEVIRALEDHRRTLEEDRNLLGFDRQTDAAARRLVEWLDEHPEVEVRRYESGFLHGKAFIVETASTAVIAGSSNFTYAGLARNNELNLGHYQPSTVGDVLDWFNKQWGLAVPYDLAGLYKARWEPHQPWNIFLRMLFENYGADLDEARAGSNLGLTAFQADGVWRAKRILHRRRGVIIADEVGLGKTYVAGELIYEAAVERRQKVLIICPATLRDSTWIPFLREKNLHADVASYEEVVRQIDHAGERNSALQGLDEYAMVVIDEAHAFRNATTQRADALHRIADSVVPKDLVLLTATPVNNSLDDLYNLIMYFARNDYAFADVGIPSLRAYFDRAIATDPDDLTAQQLFDALDATTVRRTRRFVRNHYQGDTVRINGRDQEIRFPTCEVRRVDYHLGTLLPGVFDDLALALGGHEGDLEHAEGGGVILTDLGTVLSMARYVPSMFRIADADGTVHHEAQNAGLLRSALLKRFESSTYAFAKTVEKMIGSHNSFLEALDRGVVLSGDTLREFTLISDEDADDYLNDLDDPDGTLDANGYHVTELRQAVEADRDLLAAFHERVRYITHDTDPKIDKLIEELATIAVEAQTEGIGEEDVRNKRKVLIFTYFADTAAYINEGLEEAIATDPRLSAYRGRYATVSGPDTSTRADIITGFAPTTAGTGVEEDRFDLIVTTDVLAEGVNLQQARHITNYDLPWNPMRLVQRHGRIDRIGSPHSRVFMRCFFPDENLDAILGLEERLQRKIKQAAAAVGVGTVLPGIDPVDRSITETRDRIAELQREEAALFSDGTSAAASGEEFRRMLTNAFANPLTKANVENLAWGAGTAFTRPGADPAFVFCARVGDHDKPFYRYIPLTADLTIQQVPSGEQDDQGNPVIVPDIVRDTLSCLSHANPLVETTPSVAFTEPLYAAAFDAWAVAKEDIHRDWTLRTDPSNLAPQLPRVMRDAVAYIEAHGNLLVDQDTLAARFKAPYTTRVQRAARAALNDPDSAPSAVLERLRTVADEYGLTVPEPPQPLPPAAPEDVYLICWTAIVPDGFDDPQQAGDTEGETSVATEPVEVTHIPVGDLLDGQPPSIVGDADAGQPFLNG